MTKAQHTPGPWRRNGSLIEAPQMALTVSTVSWPRIGHAPKDTDEAVANARLIAAAPELLAALNCALVYLGDDGTDDSPEARSTRAVIRAAIAAAAGKSEG